MWTLKRMSHGGIWDRVCLHQHKSFTVLTVGQDGNQMISGLIWLETRCLRVQTGIWNSSLWKCTKNSDSTSVNYNIIHTWGGKSPHCKDPFHARQKSIPALQPCPALTTTVQRRWPEKPELDFYWKLIWVLCILTYVHISQVSKCS